jgi:hypothetical protein
MKGDESAVKVGLTQRSWVAGFGTNPHSGDSLLTAIDAKRNTTNMLVVGA